MSSSNQQYPKVLYHWDGKSQRPVHNSDEEAALGPDWFDSPASAREERNSKFDAVKSLSELSIYEDKPELIDAYFKRRFEKADREQKWMAIKEYNTYFQHVLIRFRWAGRLLKNLPPETPSPKNGLQPIVWLGTARAWGDMVLTAYQQHLIQASSPLNALEQAADHYVWQEAGKPRRRFNPRTVWQNLKNREDYRAPTKPGPR